MTCVGYFVTDLKMTLRPIDSWPGDETKIGRAFAPFTAHFDDTINKLRLELKQLDARNRVLQVAYAPRDIRQDGLPRADARERHPGVVLSFVSKHGPMRFPFGRFHVVEHNLRAIALHLEHLRMAGHYGVGSDGQQYAGWLALPAPTSASTGFGSADEVVSWIIRTGEWENTIVSAEELLASPKSYAAARRRVAALLHPDTPTGDQAEFARLADADAIMTAYFRGQGLTT